MIPLNLDDFWCVRVRGATQRLTVKDIFLAHYSSDLRDWDECQQPSGDWVPVRDIFIRYGKYCVLSNLGAGAFGCVFKAWDLKVGVIVALKTIHPHIPDAMRKKLVNVFVAEALSTARLGMSQHVIKVIDLDPVTPYLVIEYCDGGSLAERMKAPYTLEDVLRWGCQISTALTDAHGLKPKHVVHHDLKPSNLLLSGETLMVSDFGGAMMMWEYSGAQTVIDYGFTRQYAAPEILDNRLRHPRALDVWSLGVILWELVSGGRPFDRNPADPLPSRMPTKTELGILPADMEALIRACLEKSPEDRPSAAECRARLAKLYTV